MIHTRHRGSDGKIPRLILPWVCGAVTGLIVFSMLETHREPRDGMAAFDLECCREHVRELEAEIERRMGLSLRQDLTAENAESAVEDAE